MPKAKQTYTTGIDQDTSKLKYKNTSYFEAHNFRVVTNEGSSTGSLENEKGNKLVFSIPDTAASYKLRRTDINAAAGSEILIVAGTPISYTPSDNILTNADLFAFLNANATIQALITANTLKLIEDDEFVYFIGLDAALVIAIVGTDCKLTTIAEAQTDLRICGMGHLDTWIIIFTTSETGANPIASTGDQIWKLKYNEYSNTVSGLSSGFLVPSTHLIYNNQLKLSTHHRIEEPITRYENDKIGRVYFTDFNNPLRSINVFDDNLWILPPGNLDIVSDVNLSKPVIQSLTTGSIPAGSTVQYAYRLINQTQGNSTIFSPASTLVTLTRNDGPGTEHNGDGTINSGVANIPPAGNTFAGASTVGTASSSVTYKIEGIDTDYDIIEHYYILWNSQDNPTVYKFAEEFVPSNGTVTVVHAGSETDLPITTLEYNALTNPLVAKTLTSKDDRLVAANIKEPIFDIDFDARAYRTKDTGSGSGDTNLVLFNKDGTSDTSYNTGNWDTIPEDHDAINPYNQQDPDVNSDWKTADQYKYFPGANYLGGKGPNVSYKFTTELGISGNHLYSNPNGGSTGYRPFTQIDRYLPGDPPITLGEKNLDGTNIEYPREGELKNMASAKINGVLRGYSRGEVYRFGITFYDLKGNPSFVKWIGDIKFPEIFDTTDDATSGITNTYKLMNWSGATITSSLNLLGIEFSVDISSIADKISGFSIVRVERNEDDKTRLGTGLVMHFNSEDIGTNYDKGVYSNYVGKDVTSNNIKIDSTGEDTINLMDRPGFTYWHNQGNTKCRALIAFCSPLGNFRLASNYSFRKRDHLQTVGYYNGFGEAWRYESASDGFHTSKNMGAWYKMREYAQAAPIGAPFTTNYPDGHQKFLIDASLQMSGAQAIGTTNSVFVNTGSNVTSAAFVINASYARDGGGGDNTPLGLGNSKQLLIVNVNGDATNWWDAGKGPSATVAQTGMFYDTAGASLPEQGEQELNDFNEAAGDHRTSNFLKFKEASYNRFLLKQYGGNAYIERSKSIYISTNHFQPVAEVSNLGTNFTFKVYGGDVYVNYYDEEYIGQNWIQTDDETAFPAASNSKLAVGLMYPCETTVNTELRFGNHFSKDRDPGTEIGEYQFEDYKILYAYNQENNVKTQFFAKDALINLTEEQRYAIKVSNLKVDGELIDNWKIFLPNNEISVEGIHGQINKIVNLKSNVFFYQNSAVGVAAINDRVTQVSESGVEIVLGTGEVISDYSYMSTETGTIHQHSVVTSGGSIYHYDDRLKKMFRFAGQGMQPISDIKGLSAFLGKIDGSLEENDVTLKNLGVHGIYDRRHNRVIMTFLNYKIYSSTEANKTYEVGDIIYFAPLYYRVITAFTAPNPPLVPSTDPNLSPIVDILKNNIFINGFTISYNEMMNAFESFLDYKPNIYLHTGRRLLSVNSFTNEKEVYEHNVGNYGQFYNEYFDSKITLILAPGADIIKVFDNIEYNAEISINDLDAPAEALKQMRFYNDYQDTGIIPLTLGTNVIRRMRKYRSSIPRDAKDTTASPKPRMRDAYIFLELEFENNANNKRLVLHDITVSFRPANM